MHKKVEFPKTENGMICLATYAATLEKNDVAYRIDDYSTKIVVEITGY